MHRFITALLLGLALLAPAIAFAETRTIDDQHLGANYGAHIPMPFNWSFLNITTDTEAFFRAHRAIVPTEFACVITGAADPAGITIEIQECDENADNCETYGAELTLMEDDLVTYSTTSFTEPDADEPLRLDEGEWFKVDVTAVNTAGTRHNCQLKYVYF
jgi:hypothetical protein